MGFGLPLLSLSSWLAVAANKLVGSAVAGPLEPALPIVGAGVPLSLSSAAIMNLTACCSSELEGGGSGRAGETGGMIGAGET